MNGIGALPITSRAAASQRLFGERCGFNSPYARTKRGQQKLGRVHPFIKPASLRRLVANDRMMTCFDYELNNFHNCIWLQTGSHPLVALAEAGMSIWMPACNLSLAGAVEIDGLPENGSEQRQ
jgi:hypothetical protein